MSATYGRPGGDEPNVVELEAAITLHASQCVRYGRYWPHYEWTHEQINLLLDQRDRQIKADQEHIQDRVRRLFGRVQAT